MSTAAEYDEDITRNVDRATDTGLGVGEYGGEAAHLGFVRKTIEVLCLTIGDHTVG